MTADRTKTDGQGDGHDKDIDLTPVFEDHGRDSTASTEEAVE